MKNKICTPNATLNEDTEPSFCSMNLYDYSQQNNIEMGPPIAKEKDKEAYEELIEEINNIKVNGTEKNLEDLENREKEIKSTFYQVNNNITEKKQDQGQIKYEEITFEQKLSFQV